MKIIVSGKNIEVTEALRSKVEKKIGKLEKYFHSEIEAHVTMSVQKSRQIVEVTIPFSGGVLRAEERNGDMYASIDKVIDSLERQIRKNKTKLQRKFHEGGFKVENMQFDDQPGLEEEQEYNIVRTKKFAIKPMAVEEAILQMNLLGHEFFMFSNAETLESNVVYRRKDGNYGLIEPED
ncbi:MAG: ribosome-associated translation inhibitor RaiA [Clostridiaceae bacterium]|nr:ribosome-associated translation inhibitor RaiA [Clostridiaceae bacterium]